MRPDAVVTVHATPAAAMAALAASGRAVPPHTTAVTDFVAHSQWMPRPVDRYCVAAEEVRNEFVARGIPPDRVVVTGVPVRAEFSRAVDATAAQRAGSSPPIGPLWSRWRARRARSAGCRTSSGAASPSSALQAVVVAGRDERLRARLTRLAAGSPVRVVGYVEDVRTLLAAADLLVTKAGGMTLAEATAAEVPLLLYG